MDTPAGRVPQVRTDLQFRDVLGTCRARLGLDRNRYTVTPGLYAVGQPDAASPVLVTANYKLSFDAVRTALPSLDLWLLVADTRGINVWCAGGKGLFSAQSITEQIRKCGLERIVSHRRLILPQLGANGVRAKDIRKATGFEAQFGPVRASDLPEYLHNGAHEAMRQVTFTLRERAAVVPVELILGWKPLLWVLLAVLMLSLFGTGFTLHAIWTRWTLMAMSTLLALASGMILFPLVLPIMPTRFFSLGGAGLGAVGAAILTAFATAPWQSLVAAGIWCIAASSYLALNFTGSTPYTSPSGVEKEMRRAIPMQAACTLCAALFFVWGNFLWRIG